MTPLYNGDFVCNSAFEGVGPFVQSIRERKGAQEGEKRKAVHRDEHMHGEIFTLLQCLHMYVKPMVHNINTIWYTYLFLDAKMHVNK